MNDKKTVGASLLAIAVHQSIKMLTDTKPSRAGSLLQGYLVQAFYSVRVGILRGAMKYIHVSAMKYIAGIRVNSTV